MPRNRMVRADFWVSEQHVDCSRDARLLFIGLWCFCDDSGIHISSYMSLKLEVFPGDSCTLDDIKKWMGELINNGLVREYAVNEKSYWIVIGWKDYQKIDKPTYRFPLPESSLKEINDSTTASRCIVDNSASTSLGVDDTLPTYPLALATNERKGKEKKEKIKTICEDKSSPGSVSKINQSENVTILFAYWQKVTNHPRAKLDPTRRRKIENALKNYSMEELKQAIDGCALTPYNMGDNDGNRRYDSINLIFRDADHIERFIENSINPPSSARKNGGVENSRAGVVI